MVANPLFPKISATIDGKLASWESNWFGSTPDASLSTVWVTATIDGQVVSWLNNWFGSSSALATATATAVPPAGPLVNYLAKPVVSTTNSGILLYKICRHGTDAS
jgi:hypothetical protein